MSINFLLDKNIWKDERDFNEQINFINKDNGNTPLHYATQNQDVKVVELLISNEINIDVQVRNLKGETGYNWLLVIIFF